MSSRHSIPVISVATSAKPLPWNQHRLDGDQPFRVVFPIAMDGDLVMSPEHLGVAYLSSVLEEAGAECSIVEVPRGDNETAAAIEAIATYQPDLVGITLTTVGVDHVTDLGARLRDRLGDDVFIAVGGALATHLGPKLLQLDGWGFVDGLVRGEGEIPVVELARALHEKTPMEDVPNLCFWKDDQVLSNSLTEAVHDLDDIPLPRRHQFEEHGARLGSHFAYLRVSTSRGCTSFCTFCNAPHARNRVGPGKPWRGCSPERVVDELEHLYRTYGCTTFDFVDSTFEDPGGTTRAKDRIAAIAQGIIDRGLPIFFNCCMQAVNWSAEDAPLVELLHRAGLEKVLVGIEGGSDNELQRWKKRSSSENNELIINLLRSHHIYVAFGFISFHPNSTFETVRDNHRFLREYMGHNFRRFTTRLELYPGAEVVEQLRDEGLLRKSYDRHLDPFGYDFRDERIAELSRLLSLLYGEAYAESCVLEEEPAPFQFETYDIVLHTFYSRVLRSLSLDDDARREVQHDLKRAEGVREDLAGKSYEFVGQCVDLAEESRLETLSVADARRDIDAVYRGAMKELRGIQMRTSMGLHRSGYNVRELMGVH